MRPYDRLDSVLVLVVALLVLIMVPFAAAYGTATNTRLAAQARTERATEYQVAAVLLENSRPVSADMPTRSPLHRDHARAQWLLQGIAHTGDAPTTSYAKSGETISVWIDSNGDLVAAPTTGTENAATAVSAAFVTWTIGASCSVLILCGVRQATSRHRMSQWAREWNELDKPPGWQVS
jgi:hypothetical protein